MQKLKELLKNSIWTIYISLIAIFAISFIYKKIFPEKFDKNLTHQYLRIELKILENGNISTKDITGWYEKHGKHKIYFNERSEKCKSLINNDSASIWDNLITFTSAYSSVFGVSPVEITAQCYVVSEADSECESEHSEVQNKILAITLVTDIENDRKKDLVNKILSHPSNCRNPIATSDVKKIKI